MVFSSTSQQSRNPLPRGSASQTWGVGALLQACAVIVMGEGAGCFVLDLCVLGCPSQEQNTGALCLGVIMRWKEK